MKYAFLFTLAALTWNATADAARYVVINFSAQGDRVFPASFIPSPSDEYIPVTYFGRVQLDASGQGSGYTCSLPYCFDVNSGNFIDHYFVGSYWEAYGGAQLPVDLRTAPIGSVIHATGGINLIQNAAAGGVPRYLETLQTRYTIYLMESSAPVEPLFFLATTVPEPATWTALILGFGITGSVLRRRHGMALA